MRTRPRSITLLCILLALLHPTCLLGQSHAAARQYYELGRSLHEIGRLDAAGAAAERSLDYAEDYSESWYLLYRLTEDTQDESLAQIKRLNNAIEADTWLSTDPALASREKAGLLLRMRRSEEAAGILEQVLRDRPDDPEGYLMAARAYMDVDRLDEAAEVLKTGMGRFSLEPRMYALFGELLYRMGSAPWARSVFEQIVRERPDQHSHLLTQAELESEQSRIEGILNTYFALGGAHPKAAVLALEQRMSPPEQYLETFFAEGGNLHLDLLVRAARVAAGEETLRSVVAERISGFTGERIVDVDRDSFWEEMIDYEDGSPVLLKRDANQDGQIEAEITWHEGEVHSLSFDDPDGSDGRTHLLFDPYPYLREVSRTRGTDVRRYLIRPLSLSYTFLRGPNQSGLIAPVHTVDFIEIPEQTLLEFAFRVEWISTASGKPDRILELSYGSPVRLQEDRNGDGVMDYRREYENGVAVRGRLDANASGIGEGHETWTDGRLSEVAFDPDEDGRFDLYLTHDGQHETAGWDYDRDGSNEVLYSKPGEANTNLELYPFWKEVGNSIIFP